LTQLDLDSFSACIIYTHRKSISSAALAAFDQFVNRGGGVLGIHSATACFKDTPHYFEILGGRFSGHGPVSSFEVEPVSGPNEPFDGMPSFTVTDELYLHEFQQGIRTHFTALHNGLPQPMVWTYYYGAGKVCCTVPGHLLQTVQNEIYQEVLLRGLAWVSR
jgi:type 1 glutamine amidotransferase